jgi:aryl-alcohol dehydrogenase-like predicted oxidoreductase
LSKQRREDFVIATKVRAKTGLQVNDEGLSRKHIMASVETSLKRLKTTYIGKKNCLK